MMLNSISAEYAHICENIIMRTCVIRVNFKIIESVLFRSVNIKPCCANYYSLKRNYDEKFRTL